ncbi:MAG: class I SAM-dependent methyltransferase, partial [Zoogloea sp.]|nr:class I SAM-dependent methyltransferase [Zoogloea sp.]
MRGRVRIPPHLKEPTVSSPNRPQLPTPSDDALAQSAALVELIRDEIRAAGGWLPFTSYMGLALYSPGLGYYSGGAHKFGPAGDFITAPELTPLFGQSLATQVEQVMRLSAPHLIEAGAGTGLLAADLLLELEQRGSLPESYSILEVSGELRGRQFDTLAARVPHLAGRVRWLDRLPDRFTGALVANEVLDVMPVHLIAWRQDGIFERGVALDDGGGFIWADRPAAGQVLAAAQALGVPLPEEGEYISELNLAGRAWIAEWAARLETGALLLVDYGYPRAE